MTTFQLSEQNVKKSRRERGGIFPIDPVYNMAIILFGDKTFNESVVHRVDGFTAKETSLIVGISVKIKFAFSNNNPMQKFVIKFSYLGLLTQCF